MVTYTDSFLSDPFFIGFDAIAKKVAGTANTTATAFPPYNLVKINDDHYLVELAVAGFIKEDISISEHNGVLTIKGERKENEEKNYLYRGIAGRKFTRMFTLSEYMEVSDAKLLDGILSISVIRNVPEEKKPRSVTIR